MARANSMASGLGRQYICVHGHFYQPPRENPWTGEIEPESSAAPYANWNERITAECYAANAAARELDARGELAATRNNYRTISFDFGPTLLSWLEPHAPGVYAAVLEGDRAAHGAMAQAYNHMILPLANARDRATQVIWGRADFCHRFGREPEGMWLPETAVNVETLEELAAAGIQFTILAPRQAQRVRRFGTRRWVEVAGGRVDPRRGYVARLPIERRITVFFYDGALAQDVAFGELLRDGGRFAERLQSALGGGAGSQEARLASVAADGETYGHHHKFGEMALAAALDKLAGGGDIRVTNYRAYLATHAPEWEVEIVENSSWSCSHGVERWRADCGCNAGHEGWHQAWRGPLRAALNWLRDELAPAYERAAGALLWNPWLARNEYIDVLLTPGQGPQQAFLARHGRRPLKAVEQARVWDLLEMQRHAMLMFTSCGWFFDEISGIEGSQVLAYAARALELGEWVLGLTLGAEFEQRLAAAPSNLAEVGNGAAVYWRQLLRRPGLGAWGKGPARG